MNALRNHPILFACEPDPLARILGKLGLSIIARKFCPDHAPDCNLLENEAAVALSLIVDVKGRRFCIPEDGPSWTKSTGSIMLVRKDTKDLTIRKV